MLDEERAQRKDLERMKRQEMRDAEIAMTHAPVEKRKPFTSIGPLNRMLKTPAHSKAGDRHEEEHPNPETPRDAHHGRERLPIGRDQWTRRREKREPNHHRRRNHDRAHHELPKRGVERRARVEMRRRPAEGLDADAAHLDQHRQRKKTADRERRASRKTKTRKEHSKGRKKDRDRDRELQGLEGEVHARDRRAFERRGHKPSKRCEPMQERHRPEDARPWIHRHVTVSRVAFRAVKMAPRCR